MVPVPRTLWRFVLVDLWRLVLLTAAILVVVLSFAAAVRFLHDGRIGPVAMLKMMLLAMPPMLQYALPFAAGLGATLAYHRMNVDNEISAAHAGGIGHRSVLLPSAATGVVLGGVILSLSNVVIPKFLRSMEEMLTRDAARFIVGAIERKEAVPLDDLLVYANLVARTDDTGGGKYVRLVLKGVFVAQIDKAGKVLLEASAESADVWLMRREVDAARGGRAMDYVVIKPHGVIGRMPGRGQAESSEQVIVRSIPISLADDPKYLTWWELGRLKNEPERINVVDERRRRLAAHLAERAATDRIQSELETAGRAAFVDAFGQPVLLHGSGIHWDLDQSEHRWVVDAGGAEAGGAGVRTERTRDDGRVQSQTARRATFQTRVAPEDEAAPVTLTLTLEQVSAGAGGGGGAIRAQTLADLRLASDPVGELLDAPSVELLRMADERVVAPGGDLFVQGPRDELRRRIADLDREVLSKRHERLASGTACLVMVLTGAVMAMRLRTSLPLTVYLWAFFPALGGVITIAAGQQMTHDKGPLGLLLLWGGVVGLGTYAAVQYAKVAKH